MKLPANNQNILPVTGRINRCGQTEAAHCVAALKLNSLCLLTCFSLAADGLGEIWGRGISMWPIFPCNSSRQGHWDTWICYWYCTHSALLANASTINLICFSGGNYAHTQMYCTTHLLESQWLLDVLESLMYINCMFKWTLIWDFRAWAEECVVILVRGTVPVFQPTLGGH